MSKVTKKDLNGRLLMVETLLGLHRVLPEQISNKQANDAIFRMQCALSSGKELAERDKVELTGKALVKAIIENGGRSKVLVRVSSSIETKFENWILTFATMKGSEVVTNNSNTWDYMAAVDIEGEPLTQSDVGL